jgi:hypothetical protein
MFHRLTSFLTLMLFLFIAMFGIYPAFANSEKIQAIHNDFNYDNNPAKLARVLDAQKAALASDKLLLVVLGATWCRDSQALAQELSSPELYSAVTERFEVISVNIGYLSSGFDIAAHYNLPVYYGTPTVLMIEPESGDIFNRVSFHEWMNSREKDEEQYWDYFVHQDFSQRVDADLSPKLKQIIADYEQQQAQRIRNAYSIAGPLLKEYRESGGAPSERFVEVWFELADYRNAVAQAVSEAIRTKSTDSLPEFPYEFVWELE